MKKMIWRNELCTLWVLRSRIYKLLVTLQENSIDYEDYKEGVYYNYTLCPT